MLLTRLLTLMCTLTYMYIHRSEHAWRGNHTLQVQPCYVHRDHTSKMIHQIKQNQDAVTLTMILQYAT